MISYDDVQTTIEPLHRQDLGGDLMHYVVWGPFDVHKINDFFLNIAGALLSKLINSWLSIKKRDVS